MKCPLCGHAKAHKHGKMPQGHQRYLCPACHQTFSESFDSLYYRRHISAEQIRQVLQAHSEGSSLRGISRTTGLAYNTVVSFVRAASQIERPNGTIRQQTGRWLSLRHATRTTTE